MGNGNRLNGQVGRAAFLLGAWGFIVGCGPAGGGVGEPSAGATSTPTAEVTPTAEGTPTATQAPEHTPTEAQTPAITPSAEPTATAADSPTPDDATPEGTPAAMTPTSVITPTPASTPTVAPTPEPTPIPTPEPTPTAAPTPTPEATAPPGLVGTGNDVGDIAYDFSLRDASKDYHDLYDYYGDVILLEFSAAWCGKCKQHAGEAEALYQKYKDDGFTYITILVQGGTGQQTTTEDLEDWVDDYDLTFPVLADEAGFTHKQYGYPSYPGAYIIDRNMELTQTFTDGSINDAVLEAAIEAAL